MDAANSVSANPAPPAFSTTLNTPTSSVAADDMRPGSVAIAAAAKRSHDDAKAALAKSFSAGRNAPDAARRSSAALVQSPSRAMRSIPRSRRASP